ncbi:hypothetical protein BZA70DRAFT_37842 [Myxozyma melibiosi]|uniref:Uncharacterized protein n=1 Tax=Myxozyma melibiosi TaxID=54550 RepID=A0ABR1FE70_9ASCO
MAKSDKEKKAVDLSIQSTAGPTPDNQHDSTSTHSDDKKKKSKSRKKAGKAEQEETHAQGDEKDDSLADTLPPIQLEFVEKPQSTPADDEMDVENDEFEFSLFSTATSVVKIDEPEPQTSILATGLEDIPQAPAVVDNKRPASYYFTDDSDETRKRQIESCAISGQDILTQSTQPWPGMNKPWRVIHLPLNPPRLISKAKAKPSKKRRALLKAQAEKRAERAESAKGFKDGKLRNWKFYDWSRTGKAPRLTRRQKDEKFAKPKRPFKTKFTT